MVIVEANTQSSHVDLMAHNGINFLMDLAPEVKYYNQSIRQENSTILLTFDSH